MLKKQIIVILCIYLLGYTRLLQSQYVLIFLLIISTVMCLINVYAPVIGRAYHLIFNIKIEPKILTIRSKE